MHKPGPQVLDHHSAEEPVVHAAGRALQHIVGERQHVEGPDAPTIVVAVLPVVHAILPPSGVLAPPLARHIVVVEPPTGHIERIGEPTLAIDAAGRNAEIEHAAQRDPAHHERPRGVMERRGAVGGKIDAVAGVVATAHVPYPRVATVVAHAPTALRNALAGHAVGAVVEREGWHEGVDEGPHATLHQGERAMPQRILQDAPRQEQEPPLGVVGPLLGMAGVDHLKGIVDKL